MSEIYPPSDDSFLLVDSLKKEILNLKNKKILEIGSGSGIIPKNLIEEGIKEENLTLCDINLDAVKKLKKDFPSSTVLPSNLFDKIKEKFDIIIFNPPYLPEDKNEPPSSKKITTGGKKGSELINRFVKELSKFLKTNGTIYLLVSSLSKGINFQDFNKKKIAEKKLFFERLYVYKLWD